MTIAQGDDDERLAEPPLLLESDGSLLDSSFGLFVRKCLRGHPYVSEGEMREEERVPREVLRKSESRLGPRREAAANAAGFLSSAVRRKLAREVTERIDRAGEVIVNLDENETRRIAGKLPSSLDEIEGDANPTQCYAQTVIEPGDLLYLNCQGGGGYGDPLHRDADAVEEDVRNGVVSATAARDIYGVILDRSGNVKEAETGERRQEIREGRRENAYLGTVLKQRISVGDGMLIDDNLVSHVADHKAVIACRHCGQVVGDNENRLHLARLNGSSDLAGPSVRATPDFYIDAPVHFEQMLCPSCFTVMHTALTLSGEKQTVSGFALAG